jgi:hypothetical protein
MQTITAESLGMERGVPSDVKHLNAVQFKVQAEEQRLIEAYSLDNDPQALRMERERRELLEKETKALEVKNKALAEKNEAVKLDTALKEMNLEYLQKLEESLKKEIALKQSKGFQIGR